MESIEQRILKDGVIVDNDILKVDSFLNHQIDVGFISDFAKGVKEAFQGTKIDKVLTVETSGIAVAFAVSEALGNLPLLFAKKSKSKIVGDDVYKADAKSFTRGINSTFTVAHRYLSEGENVLIVDDFLAEGNASLGLVDICHQAKANIVGVAIVIEKLFQGGRDALESRGIKVFAGASIKKFEDNRPVF